MTDPICSDRRTTKNSCADEDKAKISIQLLHLNGESLFPETYVRVVEPYTHVFSTFAKRRWLGRSVLDVYCSEFGSYPRSYYQAAIRQGKIRLSGKEVGVHDQITDNHVLSHTVHLHEAGVIIARPENPVTVVAETDELVVVDKPGTMPVHPCGAHMQNSLTEILAPRFGKLFTIHRLDRLTSGLVLLAKNSTVAQRWTKALTERETCEKIYLARVKGRFPHNSPLELNRIDGEKVHYGEYENSSWDKSNGCETHLRWRHALGFWLTSNNGKLNEEANIRDVCDYPQSPDECLRLDQTTQALWLHLACPVRVSSHKHGVCEAGTFDSTSDQQYAKKFKAAQTSFGVVRYDEASNTTILLCRPKTGRSHQIRLHLQYLGHPIANDPCYGGETWYADARGEEMYKAAASKLQSMNERIISEHNVDDITLWDTPASEEELESLGKLTRSKDESIEAFVRRTCVWCARSGGDDVGRAMLDLVVRSRGIWLHALMYMMTDSNGTHLSYRTDAPSWSIL